MNRQEVENRVRRAIHSVIKHDVHLLEVGASERSLTHCLAVRLLRQFPGYSIDCEYNRDGFDVKRLALSWRAIRDDDVEAVTVFPDIIVHQRGTNSNNLLVIEVKKGFSSTGHEYDIAKLEAFHRDLGYLHALHLILGMTGSGKNMLQLRWVPD